LLIGTAKAATSCKEWSSYLSLQRSKDYTLLPIGDICCP